MRMTSSMSCSTRRTPMPPLARVVRSSPSAWDSASSRPDPGSSSSRILGAMARARASSTMRARPVGMALACSAPRPPRPTPSSNRSEVTTASEPGPVGVPTGTPPSTGTPSLTQGKARLMWRHCHHLTDDSSPTCTFSPADRVPKSSRRWKVRASPSLARRCGFIRVMSVSCRCTVPRSGVWRPLMTLNSVVLPAPFGPMSPVTVPASTVRLASLSAATPPKRTATPSTVRTWVPVAVGAGVVSACGTETLTPCRRPAEGGQRAVRIRQSGGGLDPGELEVDGIDAQDAVGRPADQDHADPGEDADAAGRDLVERHIGECGEERTGHRPDAPHGHEQDEDDAGEEVEVGGALYGTVQQ